MLDMLEFLRDEGVSADITAEIKKFRDTYPEENEALRVEINTVDWSSVNREVQSAAASASMYDVFFQYADEFGSAHSQGLVLDLTPYMDEEWAGGFQPGALAEYTLEDGLYGIPFRGSGVVVIYNEDLFNRYGWRKPSSQEEMTALMQLALNEGLIPLSAAGRPDGFQIEALRGIVTNYVTLEAGNLDDADRLRDRRTDWQGELAVGAQRVKDWVERGFFGPSPLSVDEEAAIDSFLSGQAAMLLCNTNDLYQLRGQEDYLAFSMDCFLFPGPESCEETLFSDACYQDGFAVYAGTEHPQEAVQLLRGLTNPENCASWAEETGPSEPGVTGTPAAFIRSRAADLDPALRMVSPLGPMNLMPASAHWSAKSAFSDKKP